MPSGEVSRIINHREHTDHKENKRRRVRGKLALTPALSPGRGRIVGSALGEAGAFELFVISCSKSREEEDEKEEEDD